MQKLTHKALWKEMIAKGIVTSKISQNDVYQILPLRQYKVISAFLTKGMPAQDVKTADNTQNNIPNKKNATAKTKPNGCFGCTQRQRSYLKEKRCTQ